MGLFRITKEAAEEKEFEGATDWFKEQVQTAKAYNEEDGKMGVQDTPKQARILLAIEDNEKNRMVAASIKANDKKILLDALFKMALHEDAFKEFILETADKRELP